MNTGNKITGIDRISFKQQNDRQVEFNETCLF